MDPATKKWIDDATYPQLLAKWRFAPVGDRLFQGETGDYYAKVMAEKGNALSQEERVRASKSLGWER